LKELIQELNEKYNIIFINLGPKEIVHAKLKEINFEPANIIGDEYKVENGKITGANLIMINRMKGGIIAGLRSDNYNVVAVGHDIDDLFMLHNSNLSIAYVAKGEVNPPQQIFSSANNNRLALYNVTSTKEILNLIENCSL